MKREDRDARAFIVGYMAGIQAVYLKMVDLEYFQKQCPEVGTVGPYDAILSVLSDINANVEDIKKRRFK